MAGTEAARGVGENAEVDEDLKWALIMTAWVATVLLLNVWDLRSASRIGARPGFITLKITLSSLLLAVCVIFLALELFTHWLG